MARPSPPEPPAIATIEDMTGNWMGCSKKTIVGVSDILLFYMAENVLFYINLAKFPVRFLSE
jgi:hypothetical protein